MKHTALRLKTVLLVLSMLLAISILVSCDDNNFENNITRTRYVGANASGSSDSKGLIATYDADDLENYYWYYIAEKRDTGLNKGASDVYIPWNPVSTVDNTNQRGLAVRQNEFSVGKWAFSFRACLNDTYDINDVVFEGSLEFEVLLDARDIRMYVPVSYVDVAYNEDRSSSAVLKGGIEVQTNNITTNAEDIAPYTLGDKFVKKYVTITDVDYTLISAWTNDQIVANPILTLNDLDAGTYHIIMLYEYYDDAVFTNKVASYIVRDTLSVHGNLTTKLSGDFKFIKLEAWEITYEDSVTTFTNGRADVPATTGNGYTGVNAKSLLANYHKYAYGTGISLPTDTSPSDTATEDNSLNRSTKYGYNFLGWVLNADGTGAGVTHFSKVEIGPKTVYAHWQPKKSVITFKGNKGTGSTAVHADIQKNAFYDDYLPNYGAKPVRVGYMFGGYYLGDDCKDGERVYTSASTLDYNATIASVKSAGGTTITDASKYYMRTTDSSLYAKWVPEVYTLHFNNNKTYTSMTENPSSIPADIRVTFDSRTPYASRAAMDGWIFVGWGVDNDHTTTTSKMLYDRSGIVSGTDYISATNAAWVKDLSDGTEGAGSALNLYAKFRQKKTHITLNKGLYGTADGEAVVFFDDKVLSSKTLVTADNTRFPGWAVEGYYTEPNGKGAKVLDSTGAFVVDTTTTNASYGFYKNTTLKTWFKFNKNNDVDALELTLYAHYVNGAYNITFNPNDSSAGKGSTAITSATPLKQVVYNSAVGSITAPTRKGYIYEGYYLDPSADDGQLFAKTGAVNNGVNDKETATSVTSADGKWLGRKDRTVYAKWTAKTLNVTYNNNKASYAKMDSSITPSPSSITGKFVFDTTLTDMPIMTAKGWNFVGWGRDNNASSSTNMLSDATGYLANVADYTDANKHWIQDTNNGTNANDGSAFNLYAKWSPKKVNIKLDKGEFGVSDGKATAYFGNTALETAGKTLVTTNSTLNPGWTVSGYFTSPTGGIMILNRDGSFNSVTATKNAGWFDSSNRWYLDDTNDDEIDVTLFAQYTSGTYNVIFNVNDSTRLSNGSTDSTVVPENLTVTYNALIPSATSLTGKRKGYVFVGWYLDKRFDAAEQQLFTASGAVNASKKNSGSNMLVSDASMKWVIKDHETVYAKWTPEIKKVNYENGKANYSAMSATPVIAENTGNFTFDNEMPVFVTATSTGWYFTGWRYNDASTGQLLSGPKAWNTVDDYISSNKTWIYDEAPTTQNGFKLVKLYAQWSQAITNVNLEIDPRYGTSGKMQVKYDNTARETTTGYTAPTVNSDYLIEGWYSTPYFEDEYASATCYKVLNADLTFCTTSTNAAATKTTTSPFSKYTTFDHHFRQFFDSSSKKWRIWNEDDPSVPESITLFAHIVDKDTGLTVMLPTTLDIEPNYNNYFGLVYGITPGPGTEIEYGASAISQEGAFDGATNRFAGLTLVGFYSTLTDIYDTANSRVTDDGELLRTRMLIDRSGHVNNIAEVKVNNVLYVKDGKWAYDPSGKGNLKVYALWKYE